MNKDLTRRAAAAALAGELDAVRAAVTEDAAVARHWSLLMNACFGGQPEVAALLIAEGADVNVLAPTAHRYRPLHRAVEHKRTMPKTPGHFASVRLLLEHGADPLLRGSWHLHSAIAVAAFGCTEFLPLLLEHAPPEPDLYTAAVLARHRDLAALLAESRAAATRADADSRDGTWLPLQYCARSAAGSEQDRVTSAALLLDHGADPSSALDYACWSSNAAIVELLLQRGARLGDDDTVNHLACDGQVGVLEMLMRHAAVDLNGTRGTEHHGGYNPLGCAVNMRSIKGVTWFLDHGCDPNEVQSKSGETALHVAVNSGAGVPLVRLLVERGVNVDQRDAAGHTALDLARAKRKTKLADFLASPTQS